MGDSNDGDFRLLAQSEAKPECTMRGEIADQDVRQRLVIVLVLRGARRWRLRGLQDGARAVPALAGKPRLEKSLVVHGGDDVDGWFRYGELRASSARDAGDSLKIKFPFLRKNPRKNPRKALQGEISPARPVSGGSSKFHGESRRAASHLPGPPTLLPALARQFDRRLWNSNRAKEPGGYNPMPMQDGVWPFPTSFGRNSRSSPAPHLPVFAT